MPVGIRARCAGRDGNRRIGRDRGHEIEAGRVRALIGGKRQIGAVREPHHVELPLGLRLAHGAAPASAAAMRATSACATSSFDCGGHDSTPSR